MNRENKQNPDIVITRANRDELQVASDIANEVVTWLIEIGQPLWSVENVSVEVFESFDWHGEVYLASIDGEAVGVMALTWEDRHIWPEMPAGEAGYINKLSVRRRAAGKGVSSALIRHAENAVREKGRKYLRLNCDDRSKVRAFYENEGFSLVEIKSINNEYLAVKYQKLV